MLISYLERYQDGEHTRVWAELLARGAEIREEPLYGDARAVARETMTRARHNVGLLVARLRELDYRFARPGEVWVPPRAGAGALDEFERRYGPLPLSLRLWHEVVGSVNLMGAHPKLSSYHGLDRDGSDRLPCYTDPLVVWPLDDNPAPFYADQADWEDDEVTGPPYALPIAPDATLKAKQSGGGSPEVLFPNPAADAPLLGDDYWEGTPFVTFLRQSFRWGGFPGFGREYAGCREAAAGSRAEREYLTRDLLPI